VDGVKRLSKGMWHVASKHRSVVLDRRHQINQRLWLRRLNTKPRLPASRIQYSADAVRKVLQNSRAAVLLTKAKVIAKVVRRAKPKSRLVHTTGIGNGVARYSNLGRVSFWGRMRRNAVPIAEKLPEQMRTALRTLSTHYWNYRLLYILVDIFS